MEDQQLRKEQTSLNVDGYWHPKTAGVTCPEFKMCRIKAHAMKIPQI